MKHEGLPCSSTILRASDIYDRDFYDICELNGEKHIHIWGYAYKDSYASKDDTIRFVSYVGFMLKLSDFIEACKSNPEYVSSVECEYSNYLEEFSAEKELEEFLGLDSLSYAHAPLRYEGITMETPCGYYIDL